MKNLKILIVALAAFISLLTFSACTQEKCDSTCPICNLCTDDNCAVHTAGNQHCQGHATPVEQVAVVNILNDNTAYKNMVDSAAEIIYDEIKEAVAEEYNVAKNKVELSYVRIDGEGYEPTTVVAKIDNKKVVLLQYETDTINEHLPRDVEGLVLNEAGYKADDKVDQDKQSQVDAEFTSAVNAILARFATISDEITLVKANEIFSEFSSTTSVPGFENCEGIILSNIREDGTAVAFTYEYGVYQDHVLKVEGRENMTDAQIMAQIAAGNFTKETRTIDSSKTYTAPALEEKPVAETTTVGEIYDQNFANVDFSAKLEEAFQSIYNRGFKNSVGTTMFYSIDDDKISVYYDLYRNNKNSFNMMKFDLTEEIVEYLTEDVKTIVLKEAQLNATQEVEKDQSNAYIGDLQLAIDSIGEKIAALGDIELKTIETKGYITNTTDNIELDDFNEKLCPDKEVIATYVGAMGNRQMSTSWSGYSSAFDVVVVYKDDGEDICISEQKIAVPWYTNSTNESLYNTFLNDEDGTKHEVLSTSTETIKNATIAKQNEKQKLASIKVLNEYDIESPDEESAKIVADAVAAYFADELAR